MSKCKLIPGRDRRGCGYSAIKHPEYPVSARRLYVLGAISLGHLVSIYGNRVPIAYYLRPYAIEPSEMGGVNSSRAEDKLYGIAERGWKEEGEMRWDDGGGIFPGDG